LHPGIRSWRGHCWPFFAGETRLDPCGDEFFGLLLSVKAGSPALRGAPRCPAKWEQTRNQTAGEIFSKCAYGVAGFFVVGLGHLDQALRE
jgi:hypothetical protein